MKELIGNKIRKMRNEKGLSQEELAEKLHISRSALVRMENGESHTWANQLENLSHIFEVEPEEFLKNENNTQQNEHQKGGMALQNNGRIKTINHLNEKVIEILEARLREKDEIIDLLKKETP